MSYFKIGLFVISAIVIGVIGVVVLGGGKFFQKQNIIETYIDESVQGLDVGSPVKFRGVLVGNVEQITLTSIEYPTRRRYVLVRAGISPKMFKFPLGDPASPGFMTEVQRGLRVRLAPQGLTGQAYLEADYLDPKLNPPLELDWQPEYPYVPSARSRLTQFSEAVERILRNIEQVDIERLTETMEKSLETVSKLFEGVDFDKISAQTVSLLAELRQTNEQLRNVVGGADLKTAVADAAIAAGTARQILERADKPLNQVLADLPQTAEKIKNVVGKLDAAAADLPETAEHLKQSLRRLERFIAGQQRDLETVVQNIRSISANVKEITDDARTYPGQILFGAQPPPARSLER